MATLTWNVLKVYYGCLLLKQNMRFHPLLLQVVAILTWKYMVAASIAAAAAAIVTQEAKAPHPFYCTRGSHLDLVFAVSAWQQL